MNEKPQRAFLVVEDELMILGIVKSVLSSFGREVLTATTINRAREIYANCSSNIELLLTDVALADGSGLTFAAGLLEAAPKLKVILMTGFAFHGDDLAGLDEHQFVLLEKPFDIESLKRAVTGLISSPTI